MIHPLVRIVIFTSFVIVLFGCNFTEPKRNVSLGERKIIAGSCAGFTMSWDHESLRHASQVLSGIFYPELSGAHDSVSAILYTDRNCTKPVRWEAGVPVVTTASGAAVTFYLKDDAVEKMTLIVGRESVDDDEQLTVYEVEVTAGELAANETISF